MKSKPTSREDLLAAMRATSVPKLTPVSIPGWGLVHIKRPTVAEVDAEVNSPEAKEAPPGMDLAKGAARVMCDENGVRLFNPNNLDDLILLSAQPWDLLQQVVTAARVEGLDSTGN